MYVAWPGGRTSALWSFGTVFESPCGRRNIFSSLTLAGPIGNNQMAKSFVNKSHDKPEGVRLDVYECGDCGVALCVKCWEVYHTKACFTVIDYTKVLRS